MATKIQKWGNSLAVRLPKELTENLSLDEGDDVEVIQKSGTLVIRRLRRREPAFKLENMLAELKKEQMHEETDWDKPVGKEIW